MKRILVVLSLLIATQAQAEVIMWTLNENGNKIVLTDELCNNNKAMIAYILGSRGETITGCWSSDELSIHVLWQGSYLKSYDYTGWTIIKKAPSL